MSAFAEIINLLQPYSKKPILNSPASMEEIKAAERIIGKRLPDDVRAAYLLGDGEARINDDVTNRTALIFSSVRFNSIRQTVQTFLGSGGLLKSQDPADNINEGVEIFPADTVKNNHFNPGWVPIAGVEHYIAVDYDPEPNGVEGQVILFGNNYGTYIQLGTSFEQFCQFLLERYEERRMHRWFLPTEQQDGLGERLKELFLREHGIIPGFSEKDLAEIKMRIKHKIP